MTLVYQQLTGTTTREKGMKTIWEMSVRSDWHRGKRGHASKQKRAVRGGALDGREVRAVVTVWVESTSSFDSPLTI